MPRIKNQDAFFYEVDPKIYTNFPKAASVFSFPRSITRVKIEVVLLLTGEVEIRGCEVTVATRVKNVMDCEGFNLVTFFLFSQS